MSTYYKFICKECETSGGFLSRQAWGDGNFDIIETFKFLMLHKEHHPFLVSEHNELYDDTPSVDDTNEFWQKFKEDTRGVMPHSNDWEIVKTTEWKDVESKWEQIPRHFPTPLADSTK